MKKIKTAHILFFFLLACGFHVFAQKEMHADECMVEILIENEGEDVKARTTKCASEILIKQDSLFFRTELESLKFENQLMGEYFLEEATDYRKHPHIEFSGKLPEPFITATDTAYDLEVRGVMKMNGVAKEEAFVVNVNVAKEKRIEIKSEFFIAYDDYQLNIPSVYREGMGDQLSLNLRLSYAIQKNSFLNL